MASSDTASTLASGNFLGIINCLMQLRKARAPPGRRAPRARRRPGASSLPLCRTGGPACRLLLACRQQLGGGLNAGPRAGLRRRELAGAESRAARQVCNHPDLFEGRPIVSAFDMPGLVAHLPSAALRALEAGPFRRADLAALGLRLELGAGMAAWEAQTVRARPPPTVPVSVACVHTKLFPIQVLWDAACCLPAAHTAFWASASPAGSPCGNTCINQVHE